MADFGISQLDEQTDLVDDDLVPTVDASDTASGRPGGKTKKTKWSTFTSALAALFVPLARTINGKALSANVTLSAADVGADASGAAAAAYSAAVADSGAALSAHAGATTGAHGMSAFGATLVASIDGSTARTALGLGGASVLNVGTIAGTVAAGDHTHSLAAGATDVTATAAELNRNAGVTAGTAAASKVLTADASNFLSLLSRLVLGNTALTSPDSTLQLGFNLNGTAYRAIQAQANGGNRFIVDIGNTPTIDMQQSTGNRTTLNAGGALSRVGTNLPITLIPTGTGSVEITLGRVKGPDASGTNAAGTKLQLSPGPSTGNATPAVLSLQGATVGSSGATAQTNSDVLTIVNALLAQLADGANLQVGATTGTKIGTATTQKLGFWNATPVAQQVLATGAGRTVDDVITFLQTLGLCRQS